MNRFLIMCFVCLLSFQVTASKIDEKSQELRSLKQRMQQLDQKLNLARDKKTTLDSELQHIEIDINSHTHRLEKTHAAWQQEHDRLVQLQSAQEQERVGLEKEMAVLTEQLRASYEIGEHEYLQLILNQQNPAELSRLLTDYAYLAKARSAYITSIENRLGHLNQLHQSISSHTETLKSLIQQSSAHIHELQDSKNYQRAVIGKLDTEIHSTEHTLQEMQRNKQALENLLKTLKLSAKTFRGNAKQPFSLMLHNLVLPTTGQITTRFGDSLGDERARSNGIFIRAKEDESVRAIYPGRVIFANSMRGYGLLLIIDHGQGYLSLYAHNKSLYQKVGDVIRAGDLIAKVGHSGTQTQDGLYVEIRRNGKPIDPLSWLAHASTAKHSA